MVIRKKYGAIIVGDSFLTIIFCFGAFVTLLLTWNLWFDSDSMLSKIGTATSVIGLFVGTFIAIWLINRDRNKRLEENHDYKEWLLANLQGVIMAVHESIFNYARDPKDQELVKIIQSCRDDFDYWEGQIEKTNFNTLVPIKIRRTVTMFFHQGIKPLLHPSYVFVKGDDGHYLENTFLNLLDEIIHTEYIQDDKDKEIQRLLKQVEECIDLVKQDTTLKPN